MNLPRLAALLFISCLLTGVASARLGDTEAELVDRFGKTTMRSKHSITAQGKSWEMGPVLYFKQDDWMIACTLIDGRCMRIHYTKPGDWTEDQIRLVLSTNSQGVAWTENSKATVAKLQRSWRRSDGSTAEWSKINDMELVWSAYHVAKAKVEERAKIAGMKKPKI